MNRTLLFAALCGLASAAQASCGTATQTVTVAAPGKAPLSWTPRDDAPKRYEAAGAALGIAVTPSGRAAATRQAVRGRAEGLWTIRLYDLAAAPPVLLSTAYGPPNSTHEFAGQGVTVRLINGGCT